MKILEPLNTQDSQKPDNFECVLKKYGLVVKRMAWHMHSVRVSLKGLRISLFR